MAPFQEIPIIFEVLTSRQERSMLLNPSKQDAKYNISWQQDLKLALKIITQIVGATLKLPITQ